MVPYRIYKMSPDNHIVGIADEIELDSDQDAIKHAKTKLDGLDLEVWHGRRVWSSGLNRLTSDRPSQFAAFFPYRKINVSFWARRYSS